MPNLLFRTCWSDKDYQEPTPESFAADSHNDNFINWEGYGLELWNFNTNELIDSHLYGYVCPNFKTLNAKKHNIWFYTKSPERKLYLVGYYRNAYFLTDQERQELSRNRIYKDLLKQRIDQIYSTLQEIPKFKQHSKSYLRKQFGKDTTHLKLRVTPEHAVLFSKKIPFTLETWSTLSPDKQLNHRYKGYNFIPDINEFRDYMNIPSKY